MPAAASLSVYRIDKYCTPRCDVGQVRDPQRVGARGREVALDQVQRTIREVRRDGRSHAAPPHDAFEAHRAHQPRDRTAGDSEALAPQLLPDLRCAVAASALVPDALDLGAQSAVALRACRAQCRIGLASLTGIVGRRSDRQHSAAAADGGGRLDSVVVPVVVDEGHHQRGRRSISASAKYADALRRISLARRSSRFSRSSSLSRMRSSVVGPARRPWSRSACRIQLRSVSAVQPIFPARLGGAGQRTGWRPTARGDCAPGRGRGGRRAAGPRECRGWSCSWPQVVKDGSLRQTQVDSKPSVATSYGEGL